MLRHTRSPYLPQRPFRHHSTMQNPAIVVKNHRFLLPIRSVATAEVVFYLSHTLRSRVVTQNEARPGVTWNLRIVICEFHVVPGLFCFRATSGNRSLTLHAAEGPRGRRGPSTAKGQGNDDDGITRIEADGIRGTGDRRNRCSGHRNRNHRNRRGRGGDGLVRRVFYAVCEGCGRCLGHPRLLCGPGSRDAGNLRRGSADFTRPARPGNVRQPPARVGLAPDGAYDPI